MTPPTSRPFQGEACLLRDYRTTIHPDGGFCLRIFHGFREPRGIKRNPGRGSQRLRRALGGTRIPLAAAPTAPPCICRWQRSSLLHRTVRRALRVALAAFSAAPWQGFEKAASAAPALPPCFRRRRRSAPLLFESTRIFESHAQAKQKAPA